MNIRIQILTIFCFAGFTVLPVWAQCPSADITGDCYVDLSDLAALCSEWLTGAGVPEDMVSIPGGTFDMGDALSNESNEKPVHTVYLNPFMIGRFEVTNLEYCQFLNDAWSQGNQIVVGSNVVYKAGSGTTYPYCDTVASSSYSRIVFNGSVFTVVEGKEYHPVVMVSWYGVVAYANWRSSRQGLELCYDPANLTSDLSKHGYRLPTEAEWEYAARGGLAGKQYPWGDAIVASRANYWTSGDPYEVDPYPYTTPVGFYNGTLQQRSTCHWPGSATTYQTTNGVNGYGLYDIAGNVVEWCNDYSDPAYYSVSPYDNPPGPIIEACHVLRGGSWDYYHDPTSLRVAYRSAELPDSRYFSMGFRLVLDSQ
jgi:formylglycine-generating enzyme